MSIEIQSSFRKCLDVQANTTRNRFCKANISYMANGQVLRIACRQSQRSVCFVKQFATMHVIRGLCYNACYMWTLLRYVLYVDFATLCVIHGLWTSICLNTWIQCAKFEHQTFENSVWLSVLSVLIKGAVFGRMKKLCILDFPIDAQCIFKAQHLKFRKPLI